MNQQQYVKPSLLEALIIIGAIVTTIAISIIQFEATPSLPMLLCIIALLLYGAIRGVRFEKLQASMTLGASSGIGAVFIFLLIGVLISSWLIGGTIPTILFYGLSIISASYFYAIVFLLTSLVGTVIGSSLTTVATIGVALMSMAGAVDASLAITAGAIVSGAFFGDKMSPLSDTTNLAASIVGIDLFSHIRNMLYTTIPAFIISLVAYAVLSPRTDTVDTAFVTAYQNALVETNLVHFYSLIPIAVLIICTLCKIPALLTLAFSSLAGVVLSYFHLDLHVSEVLQILYSGFEIETGFVNVDELLNRGGMSSMYFTILLVILALSLGGLLFALGVIQTVLAALEKSLRTVGHVITGTAFTAIGINVLIGEQYLSILLTGEAFKEKYKAMKLHPKNLARVMEDAGTVINPLVPWSVCGIFIAKMLGVSVIDYLPFALFCLLSPVLTIAFGWLQLTITKQQ